MDKENSAESQELSGILDGLTSITGRILQISDRKAGVFLGAGTNVLVGSAFAASITGIVGTIGTASTGTAIAGLSGAAKTTATLYWLGGILGGGVAAGAVVVGAGTLGFGIYGSLRVRRAILGHARREESLSEQENRIIQAIHVIAMSIRIALDNGQEISLRELILFLRIGVIPVLDEIDAALSVGSFDDLKPYHRLRLRGHIYHLRSRQRKLEMHDPS